MRTEPNEKAFSEWLLKLGNGEITNNFNNVDSCEFIQIPKNCIVTDIISAVYGDIEEYTADDFYILQHRAILSPRNDGCDTINADILDKLPGALFEYYSADSLQTDDEQEIANFTTEYLNSITPSGMPPHRLTLKIGVPIMLLRNINIAEGLCNGTRLLVRKLFNNLIDAEITIGQLRGNRVLIPRMDLTSDETSLPFTLKRRQFPIRVCFAMTINKAQGQTFDGIGIYLPDHVFAHGQLYVAFSRVRSWLSVKVQLQPAPVKGKKSPKVNTTKNVVYKNLLSSLFADS